MKLVIFTDLYDEIKSARAKHPKPFGSPHEAYGILAEEVAEFFDEVRRKRVRKSEMKKELLQVAAVAVRAVEDLGL